MLMFGQSSEEMHGVYYATMKSQLKNFAFILAALALVRLAVMAAVGLLGILFFAVRRLRGASAARPSPCGRRTAPLRLA